MNQKLTERQSAILSFIIEFAEEHGYPPTIPEIQHEFDIKSPNGVNNHIKALTRKGYIKRDSSRARALEIIGKRDGIPILGRVAAGAPILAEENLEGHFNLRDLYRPGNDVFMLRVQGESMIKAGIHDGDYVIVHMQNIIDQGEIGVAIIDNEATVKRIYIDSDVVRLVPENDTMAPFSIPRSDPGFRIGGRVMGVVRKL